VTVIRVDRPPLRLVPLSAAILAALLAADRDPDAPVGGFRTPAGWPLDDPEDRGHAELWLDRVRERPDDVDWMARAIVDDQGRMVGHAGFHLPPLPIERALGDPTFDGEIAPADAGAVEVGYTVFPDYRRRGIATAAVQALVDWAFRPGGAGVVLATVDPANAASLAVLARVGGFAQIGECTDGDTRELVFRRDRG
jgi:RimJ/RimL family protein N-acetyltransferase